MPSTVNGPPGCDSARVPASQTATLGSGVLIMVASTLLATWNSSM